MAIELYATAGSVEKDLRNHVVIVVDVLRATSVMVTAVEHGVRFIIPVSEVEEAVDMARQLGNQRVLKPIPEFHLSNSPLEYTPEMVADRVMVMTTTNGTRAILRAKDARVLLLGSFLNASAVAHVARENGENIAIVCAGTNGKFSLDDILCSGAIISRLLELDGNQYLDDLARTALTLYDSYKDDLRARRQRARGAPALPGDGGRHPLLPAGGRHGRRALLRRRRDPRFLRLTRQNAGIIIVVKAAKGRVARLQRPKRAGVGESRRPLRARTWAWSCAGEGREGRKAPQVRDGGNAVIGSACVGRRRALRARARGGKTGWYREPFAPDRGGGPAFFCGAQGRRART